MDIQDLKHVKRNLSYGGKVLILNTGAPITAEDTAMLQALHSRSIGGIDHHLGVLAKRGSGGLMKGFYVGYGHKSIGDCGVGTIFIEGVSMLAAKAIQDWRLYSGQEASTRYIDFAAQKFLNPHGTIEGEHLLERLRDFYLKGLEQVKVHVKNQHPYKNEWDEKDYEKTVKARAFDIMRGFLPAGAVTNLAWTSNLRQMADSLMYLRHHPLHEVQEIAKQMESALQEAFPNSFGHKRYEKTEDYNARWMKQYYYEAISPGEFRLANNSVDYTLVDEYLGVLERRPKKTELPPQFAECGTMRFEFMLDFGSFRDIQRHRSVVQRMPLLTTKHGFHQWYLEELPEEISSEARDLLRSLIGSLRWGLGAGGNQSKYEDQYYIPMGYQLPNRLTGDIRALVYMAELRATRFVHPTLRKRAYQIARVLEDQFGMFGLKVHTDDNPNAFDVKRGKQDIVEKTS